MMKIYAITQWGNIIHAFKTPEGLIKKWIEIQGDKSEIYIKIIELEDIDDGEE